MAFEIKIPTGKGKGKGKGKGSKGSNKSQEENTKGMGKLGKGVFKGIAALEIVSSLFSDVIKIFSPIAKLLSLLLLVIFMPLMPVIKLIAKAIAGLIKIFSGEFGDVAAFIGKLILGIILLVGAFFVSGIVAFVALIALGALLIFGALKMLWGRIKSDLKIMWGFLVETWNNYLKPAFLLIWEGIKWFVDLWSSIWLSTFEIIKMFGIWIWDIFVAGFDIIKNFGIWIWDIFVAGLEFIADLGSKLWEWFKTALSGIANLGTMIWNHIKGFFGGGGGSKGESEENPLQDFLMRPGQGPVSFSPQDTIIGVKDINTLKGSTTININNPVVRSDADIKKLANEVSRQLQLNAKRGFS